MESVCPPSARSGGPAGRQRPGRRGGGGHGVSPVPEPRAPDHRGQPGVPRHPGSALPGTTSLPVGYRTTSLPVVVITSHRGPIVV